MLKLLLLEYLRQTPQAVLHAEEAAVWFVPAQNKTTLINQAEAPYTSC